MATSLHYPQLRMQFLQPRVYPHNYAMPDSHARHLDTFSTMIEACALDVHAYTVLVNNLTYGDSRVRAPGKKSFERDLARLRGGMNDFCVTVELDIEKLRAFQSREKRWPEDDDPFKPVPEDFEISSSRKHCPPK